MEHNQTTNFRNSAAQFFLGSIALAFVTLAFFRLHVDLASAAFAYLIVIVLLSLMGSFIASALLAVTSAAGLADFFVPAIFSFWTDNHNISLWWSPSWYDVSVYLPADRRVAS